MGNITAIDISASEAEEQKLKDLGFTMINVNLHPSLPECLFLWYTQSISLSPITRMDLSCNDQEADGLLKADYIKIDKNLNVRPGIPIYLWYYRGENQLDTAIGGVAVTDDTESEITLFKHGWERLQSNVNRIDGGPRIHIWMLRSLDVYIADITATSSEENIENFKKGYVLLDSNIRRDECGNVIFLWYLPSRSCERVTNLGFSTTPIEELIFTLKEYTKVPLNFCEGEEYPTYLWKKIGSGEGIRVLSLACRHASEQLLKDAGFNVIEKDLNLPVEDPYRSFVYLAYK